MALKLSTGLRNFVLRDGSYKRALMNGVLKIYTGLPPTNADDPVTGTLLVTITKEGLARTPEVLSQGSITFSGTNGQITGVTVNGIQLLSSPVTVGGSVSLTDAVAEVASQINTNLSEAEFTASASEATLYINGVRGTGDKLNGWVVSASVSGGDLAIVSTSDMAGGVNPVNGLTFGDVVGGQLTKAGIWQGTAVATGTAGCFQFCGSVADDNSSDPTSVRIVGTVGSTGADLVMSSVSITSGAVIAITAFTLTHQNI